jgi:exodeoxyribonuclease VIII
MTIHLDMSDTDYFAIDALSSSQIKQALKGEFEPFKRTSAMALGSAIDCAVTEPKRFLSDFVCGPDVDRRTKQGKEDWKEFKEKSANGRDMISVKDWDIAMSCADSIYSDQKLGDMLERSDMQVAIEWVEPKHQQKAKSRIDWVDTPENIMWDLKSTRSISKQFEMDIIQFGYHIQAAFYLDAWNYHYPDNKIGQFNILAVEKKDDFGFRVVEIPNQMIEVGRDLYKMGIDIIINRKIGDCPL